ncbi:MAG: hypothetical protein H6659_01550 [Ardenticatenaceae bacterium]|nr:hypothetical protein [Anaerolineales bacterium]MCB8982489.1 hypothetical protein [Ardenticatenaceae bacterium]
MKLFETSTESFIVKIWTEEPAAGTERKIWRGQVTHVLSGEQRDFRTLAEIERFMLPYLRELGMDVDSEWLRRR